MDPEDGQNGICDECISGETERQKRKAELERMLLATDCEQMEMEEFLNA